MMRRLPVILVLMFTAELMMPSDASAARCRRTCQRVCRAEPRCCAPVLTCPPVRCCQPPSTVAQPGTNLNIGDCICVLYSLGYFGEYAVYFAEDCQTYQGFGLDGIYPTGECDPACQQPQCFTYNGTNGHKIRQSDATHFYDPRITTGKIGDLPAISKLDFDTKLNLTNSKLTVTPVRLTGTGPVDISDPLNDGRAIVRFTVGASPTVYYAKLHQLQATVTGSARAKTFTATCGQEINDPTQAASANKPAIIDLGNIVTQVAPHVLIANYNGTSFQVIMASI